MLNTGSKLSISTEINNRPIAKYRQNNIENTIIRILLFYLFFPIQVVFILMAVKKEKTLVIQR